MKAWQILKERLVKVVCFKWFATGKLFMASSIYSEGPNTKEQSHFFRDFTKEELRV